MAAAGEGTCHSDPNFAVICSFLEKYGDILGLPDITFTDLQQYLEDTKTVSRPLIDLHVRLLKRIGKSNVNHERFERSITKFCFYFSDRDGWEVERFGYRHAPLSTKLRVLKNLLECQFDYNVKFKEKINELGAEEMRFQPAGRDRDGMTYWYLLDKDLNVFVYREEPDDENAESWKLLCSDRFQLAQLVERLRNNTQRNFLGEDEESKSSIFTDESKTTSKEGTPDREEKPPDKGLSIKIELGSVKKEISDSLQPTSGSDKSSSGVTVKTENMVGEQETAITSTGIKLKIKTEYHPEAGTVVTGEKVSSTQLTEETERITDSPKDKERTKKRKKKNMADEAESVTKDSPSAEGMPKPHTETCSKDGSHFKVSSVESSPEKNNKQQTGNKAGIDDDDAKSQETVTAVTATENTSNIDGESTKLLEQDESCSKEKGQASSTKDTNAQDCDKSTQGTASVSKATTLSSSMNHDSCVGKGSADREVIGGENEEVGNKDDPGSVEEKDAKETINDPKTSKQDNWSRASSDPTSTTDLADTSGVSVISTGQSVVDLKSGDGGKTGFPVSESKTETSPSGSGDSLSSKPKNMKQEDSCQGCDSRKEQGSTEPEAVGGDKTVEVDQPLDTHVDGSEKSVEKSAQDTVSAKQLEQENVPPTAQVTENASVAHQRTDAQEKQTDQDIEKQSNAKTATELKEATQKDEATFNQSQPVAESGETVSEKSVPAVQVVPDAGETDISENTVCDLVVTSSEKQDPDEEVVEQTKASGGQLQEAEVSEEGTVAPEVKFLSTSAVQSATDLAKEFADSEVNNKSSVSFPGKDKEAELTSRDSVIDESIVKTNEESLQSLEVYVKKDHEDNKPVDELLNKPEEAGSVQVLQKNSTEPECDSQEPVVKSLSTQKIEDSAKDVADQTAKTDEDREQESEDSTHADEKKGDFNLVIVSKDVSVSDKIVTEEETSTQTEKTKQRGGSDDSSAEKSKENAALESVSHTNETSAGKAEPKSSGTPFSSKTVESQPTQLDTSSTVDSTDPACEQRKLSEQISNGPKDTDKDKVEELPSDTSKPPFETDSQKLDGGKGTENENKKPANDDVKVSDSSQATLSEECADNSSKADVKGNGSMKIDDGVKEGICETTGGSAKAGEEKDSVQKGLKAKRRGGRQTDEPHTKTACSEKDEVATVKQLMKDENTTSDSKEQSEVPQIDDSKQAMVNGHGEMSKESDETEDVKEKETPTHTPSKKGKGRGGARGRGRGRGGSRVTKRVAPEPDSEETNSEPAEKRAKRGGRRSAANSRGRGSKTTAKPRADSGSSSDSDLPISRLIHNNSKGRGGSQRGRGGAGTEKTNNKKKTEGDEEVSSSSSDDLPLSKAAKKKKIVGEDSSDFEPEEPVVPAKKGRAGAKTKKAKAGSPAKEPEVPLQNTRRSLRIQTMKKKAPDPGFEVSSEGGPSGDTSSEASLQSEDDTEDEFSPGGRNRQRQAALKKKEEEEVPVDDTPCKICEKCTHPDMMLLCDSCDAGHHMACLRPPLMAIPEGDWFCPPCEHAKLIEKLAEYVRELETSCKKKDRLVRRKERLAFVGISLDNILKEKKEPPVKRESYHEDEDEEEEEEEEDDEEEDEERRRRRPSRKPSRRAGHSQKRDKHYERDESPLPKEVYAKRSCRQRSNVSYQFKEYDELITAAIEEDVKEPKPPRPPGKSRGKDMSNILGMDSDEEKELRRKQKEEELAAEAAQEGRPPPVVKKKPRRRLTTLDSDENQEDEEDSGEEFKLSESDDDSEASPDLSHEEEASEDDSGDWRPQRTWYNRAASRRSSRTKSRRGQWSRYDKDFVVDDEYDSDEAASKRRSTRNSSRRQVRYRDWESFSESESMETEDSEASLSEISSDDSAVRRKRRNKKPRRKYVSASEDDSSGSEYMVRSSKAKKRRKAESESEEETAAKKTSKSKMTSHRNTAKQSEKSKRRSTQDEEDYGSETEVEEEEEKVPVKKKKNVLRDSSSEEEEKPAQAPSDKYGEDEDTEIEEEPTKKEAENVDQSKEGETKEEVEKEPAEQAVPVSEKSCDEEAEQPAGEENIVGTKTKKAKVKKGKGKKANIADEEEKKPERKDTGAGTTDDSRNVAAPGQDGQGQGAVPGAAQPLPNFLETESKPPAQSADPGAAPGSSGVPPPQHTVPDSMHTPGEVGFRPQLGVGFRPPMEGGFRPPHDGRFPPDGSGFAPDQMGFRPPFPHGPYPMPGEQMRGQHPENFHHPNAGNYMRPPGIGPFGPPGHGGPQPEGFRPPQGSEGFRPPHGPEGFRSGQGAEGFRSPQGAEGFRHPPPGSEGFRPPSGSEGFRPPHSEGFQPRGPEGFRPHRPEGFHPGGPYPPFHRPPQQYFPPGQQFQGPPPPGYGMYPPHQFPAGPGQGQFGPGPHSGPGQFHSMMPPVSQVPGGPPPGRGGFMIDNLLRNNSGGPSFSEDVPPPPQMTTAHGSAPRMTPPHFAQSQQPPHMTPPQQPPHMTPPQQPPHMTPPQQPPHMTPPQQPPHMTPPQQQPHMTPPQQQPHMTPPQQPPHMTPPQQPPHMTPPQQPPHMTPPQQPPMTPPHQPSQQPPHQPPQQTSHQPSQQPPHQPSQQPPQPSQQTSHQSSQQPPHQPSQQPPHMTPPHQPTQPLPPPSQHTPQMTPPHHPPSMTPPQQPPPQAQQHQQQRQPSQTLRSPKSPSQDDDDMADVSDIVSYVMNDEFFKQQTST